MKTQEKALEEKDNDFSLLEADYYKKTKTKLLDPFSHPPRIPVEKKLTVSVIIPAGNVESSIISCLKSIEKSSFNILNGKFLEVVVVSDGSTDKTWDLLKHANLSLNLKIVKQNHYGQARALNTGISVALNDIIICCDADMVLSYYTIEHFVSIHQQLSSVLLVGFRSDTPSSDLRVNLDYISLKGVHAYSEFYHDERIVFPIPGWPSNMCLESENYKKLGFKRGLWMRGEDPWLLPDLVFGAIFSLLKSTYYSIGGYDERFEGWGCTDGYLASKAIAAGSYVIPVYAASALHISHPNRSKDKQKEYEKNRKLFKQLMKSTDVSNFPNWLDKASERIIESHTYTKDFSEEVFEQNNIHQIIPEYLELDSLISMGKFTDAFKLIDLESEDNQTLYRLGECLLGLHKYEEAVDKYLKIGKTIPEAAIKLGIAYAACGEFRKANQIMSEFAAQNPDSSPLIYWLNTSADMHILRGVSYFNQEFYETALRCFEAALISEPENNLAREKRSKCLVSISQS